MTNNITKISIILLLIFTISSVNAQQATNSLYSRYGLGEIQTKGFGQNRSMGGTAIAITNPTTINLVNPASYSAIPMQSFTFELGYSTKLSKIESGTQNMTAQNNNISYLAFGFPVTKYIKACFGLIPYSNVGYDITSFKTITEGNNIKSNVTSKLKGSGGLYTAFIGNAFKPFKGFSVGYNVNYMFGTLEKINKSYFLDFSDASTIIRERKIQIKDFYFNLGLQYTKKLTFTEDKPVYLTFGAIFDTKQELSAELSDQVTVGHLTNSVQLEPEIRTSTQDKGSIEIPMNIGFGASINTTNFLLSADYTHQDWTDFDIFDSKSENFTKAQRFAVGAGYTPSPNSTSYWASRQYRVGAYMGNSFLQMNDAKGGYEQIKEYGLTFGLDLFWRSTRSDYNFMNLAIELGQRGTTNNNLIEEKFLLVHLNFSLHSLWFMKYKYQ